MPAASIAPYGKGKIAAAYFNLGQSYCDARTHIPREFVNSLVRQLFPHPIVEVSGSHYVDVAVNRIDGRLAINLVNTAGPHNNKNIRTFDEVPRLGPLTIKIRSAKRPAKVTLQPQSKRLDYEYSDGQIKLTLPRLDIYEIIIVE